MKPRIRQRAPKINTGANGGELYTRNIQFRGGKEKFTSSHISAASPPGVSVQLLPTLGAPGVFTLHRDRAYRGHTDHFLVRTIGEYLEWSLVRTQKGCYGQRTSCRVRAL